MSFRLCPSVWNQDTVPPAQDLSLPPSEEPVYCTIWQTKWSCIEGQFTCPHTCTVYTYLTTYKTLGRHKDYSEYHLMFWPDRMNPTIYYLMAILNFLPPSNGMLCSSVLKQLKFVLNKVTLVAPPQLIQLVWHIYTLFIIIIDRWIHIMWSN